MKRKMTYFKQMIVLALIAMMVLVHTSVFAEEEKGSIEITDQRKNLKGEIAYDAYRIFDMTTDGNKDVTTRKYTSVAYTVNPAWENFFKDTTADGGGQYLAATDTNPPTLDPIAFNGETRYINITQTNVAEFAKKAFAYSQKNNINATVTDNATGQFTDLDLGYYMIYPRGASTQVAPFTSIVSLTSTSPNATIEQKAEYPYITKTADDLSVELGQTVTWTIKGKVPDTTGFTTYDYIIKDKTSAGLTFDGADTIKVTIGGSDVTANCDISTEEEDFSVKIPVLGRTYNEEIVLTYTTTVNEAAVGVISENNATLTYSNDPKDSTDKTTTPSVKYKVFSSKIIIDKFGQEGKKLEGVQFVLKCKSVAEAEGTQTKPAARAGYYYKTVDGKVTWVSDQDQAEVFTTDADGAAVINGLENGEYDLIETATIPGYNKLTAPVQVTIAGVSTNATKLSYTKSIENKTGALLPTTGGIGTTILYMMGAVLITGAGLILIARRRAAV